VYAQVFPQVVALEETFITLLARIFLHACKGTTGLVKKITNYVPQFPEVRTCPVSSDTSAYFCQNSTGRKQQIIIKYFKVAKNSMDPNKYHLVKAFSDIKILFM
jgi:hypothetical protein